MSAIQPSTATVATVFCHVVLFVMVAVFNFSVYDNELPINMGYGISLLLASLVSLITGTAVVLIIN